MGGGQELLDVFVVPDIGLDLEVKFSEGDPGAAGSFVVQGPARKLGILKHVAQGLVEAQEIQKL